MDLQPLAHGRKKGAAYLAALLKTGQTTRYNSELDDGYYGKGLAKSYTVNTSGSQSGTTNVDLAHYAGAAGGISFNNTTKKISDSGNGLAIFKTGDVILTNSPNNPGPFTITTGNVAGEIVCSGATLVDETPAGAITISKREAISNNTVLDNNTGLTWLRYPSAKMGSTSTGKMPWSGQLYDIFAYCAAANAANLGGHNDWRIPNYTEVFSLVNISAGTFDGTAFPTATTYLWTSTTARTNTNAAIYRDGGLGSQFNIIAKTDVTACLVLLVRGG